jgi:hypothetical protein
MCHCFIENGWIDMHQVTEEDGICKYMMQQEFVLFRYCYQFRNVYSKL